MERKKASDTGLVYSTEHGRMCPVCSKPSEACICAKRPAPAGDGVVRVSLETKGRKGSGVTLISGLTMPQDDLKELAKRLKQRCGSGGTIKDGTVEIQGDHRDLVVGELQGRGYKVKRLGG